MNNRPHARDDVRLTVRGGEALLDDQLHGKVHVLNETACFIWQMCDGRHTVEDIEVKVRTEFDVPPEIDVRRDVHRTLQALKKRDLFESVQH